MPRSLNPALVAIAIPFLLIGARRAAADGDRFGEPLPAGAVARLQAAHLRELERPRMSLPGRMMGVALSADGSRLVSFGYESGIRFWDAVTGDERPRSALAPAVPGRRFEPKGAHILPLAAGWPSRLIDGGDGETVVRFEREGEGGPVLFAPDGKTLAGYFLTRHLGVWDAATGKILKKASLGSLMVGAYAFAYLPDGTTLVTGCSDGTVRFWDAATLAEKGRFPAHDRPVGALAVAPDGASLATRGYDGTLALWDLKGRLKAREVGVYGQASLLFTPDGKYLVSPETGVALREAGTLRLLSRTRQNTSGPMALALTPDGKRVFWADQQFSIRMARIVDGRLTDVEPQRLLPLSLAFTAGSKEVVTSGDDFVRFWDVGGGGEKRRFAAEPDGRTRLALAADGASFVAASPGGGVVVRDAVTGAEKRRLCPPGALGAVAVAAGAVAVVDGDAVRLWDATGAEKAVCRGHKGGIADIAFAADGSVLASAAEEGSVVIWDAATGAERFRLPTHEAQVSCVALSADGQRVATGDWAGRVRLWALDGPTPRELRAPPRHDDNVAAVAFSPDGRRLASGGWDRVVRLWDVGGGREAATFRGHTDEVCSLAFAPNGLQLASGSRDHTVLLWPLADR